MSRFTQALAWARKNERHIGAVLFIFGFATDLATFTLLSVALVNIAFIGYLALAAVCTYGSHIFSGVRENAKMWRRTLSVVFPLGAQYAMGSLLSGCLIFYAKSAAVIVSWPFLLILVGVFIGNEYFRTYYKYLAFQAVLLFFGIYAYLIFAVPLLMHRLGPWIFLLSTLISVVLFAGFLWLLSKVHRPGFFRGFRYMVTGAAGIVIVMLLCYFTGLIPPIPLSLSSVGIYHDVHRDTGHYIVSLEQDRPWWNILPQTVHHAPGTPLFAFTAVTAPFQFGTYVLHVWEWKDPSTGKWEEKNRIAFVVTGGRDGGYRGYSEVVNPAVGSWRLTVETPDRQVIGRLYFTVANAETPPALIQETK